VQTHSESKIHATPTIPSSTHIHTSSLLSAAPRALVHHISQCKFLVARHAPLPPPTHLWLGSQPRRLVYPLLLVHLQPQLSSVPPYWLCWRLGVLPALICSYVGARATVRSVAPWFSRLRKDAAGAPHEGSLQYQVDEAPTKYRGVLVLASFADHRVFLGVGYTRRMMSQRVLIPALPLLFVNHAFVSGGASTAAH